MTHLQGSDCERFATALLVLLGPTRACAGDASGEDAHNCVCVVCVCCVCLGVHSSSLTHANKHTHTECSEPKQSSGHSTRVSTGLLLMCERQEQGSHQGTDSQRDGHVCMCACMYVPTYQGVDSHGDVILLQQMAVALCSVHVPYLATRGWSTDVMHMDGPLM